MVTPLSLKMEELHFSQTTQPTILLSLMNALKAINYKMIFQRKHVLPTESGQAKPSDAVSFIKLFFSMINEITISEASKAIANYLS